MKEYRLKWIDWVIVVLVMVFYTYGAFGLAREETRELYTSLTPLVLLSSLVILSVYDRSPKQIKDLHALGGRRKLLCRGPRSRHWDHLRRIQLWHKFRTENWWNTATHRHQLDIPSLCNSSDTGSSRSRYNHDDCHTYIINAGI